MRCVIILSGEVGALGFKSLESDFVIACDGGYQNAQKLGITPDILIGDMDSITELPPQSVSTKVFPVIKDDTDCMIAIKEGISRGHKDFSLLCGFGGRVDHIIGNIQSIAYLEDNNCTATLHGDKDTATIIKNNSLTISELEGSVFSVFAYGGEARGVNISGAKYNIQDVDFTPNFPLGVSNAILKKEAIITVKSGRLLVIRSKL